MFPVIYSPTSSEFMSNGIGVLLDCSSCKVTEERNGIFEAEFTYPVNGQHADAIVVEAIVKATAHYGDDGQLFRIYKVEKNFNGELQVYCQHVSYQLSMIPCRPFSASNAVQAFSLIRNYMVADDNPFTFITDKDTTATFGLDVPYSTKMVLGGVEGSILDTYRGEYEFDNFIVILHSHRGSDRGVVLRYGKNLTDLRQDEDIAETFTGVYPYYKDNEGNYLELDEKVIYCENADNFPYKRVETVDLTSEFDQRTDEYGDPVDTLPTKAELRAMAEKYMEDHDFGIPSVNLEISFEPIWDYDEYAGVSALETVNLCDTVKVFFPELNVTATAKVIKTVYDTLLDKYESLEIGSAKASFSDVVAKATQQDTEKQISASKSSLELSILRATEKITGAKGGYIYTETDADGNPKELYIMDNPNKDLAVKLWRWNLEGLAYSKTGIAGPYELAITADGEIVADFITTGTLDASLINVLHLNAASISVDRWANSLDNVLSDISDEAKSDAAQAQSTADAATTSANEASAIAVDAQALANEALAAANTASGGIEALQLTTSDLSTIVNALSEDYSAIQNYMETDTSGALVLAAHNSDFKVKISSSEIGFYNGDNKMAFFTGEQFVINKGTLITELNINPFAWVRRSNGHLSLIYKGNN